MRKRKVKTVGDSTILSTTSVCHGRCGLFTSLPLANHSCLCGEIDSHWTPADTTPATDATRASILIVPAAKLMCQPLPVTAGRIRPHHNAMDITMPGCKTGIPFAGMQTFITFQRGLLIFTVTKAGRTNGGAVAA